MAAVPSIDLGQVAIPQLGFGVFQIPPGETAAAVTLALETGYRHVDTAAAYGNERGVGEALAGSSLSRDEVFVTTKVWNSDHGHDEARASVEASLDRLGLDHVDLVLIHWPVPARDRYVETWEALIAAREDGLTRAIGVSNFTAEHLERLGAETGELPPINQIEVHPYLQQPGLLAWHREHGVATEAWSPLAKGDALDDPAITQVAAEVGRTPAQVVIRWHIELGSVVIPKSITPARIRENFEVFDFELGDAAMTAIGGLDRGERTGPNPLVFGR